MTGSQLATLKVGVLNQGSVRVVGHAESESRGLLGSAGSTAYTDSTGQILNLGSLVLRQSDNNAHDLRITGVQLVDLGVVNPAGGDLGRFAHLPVIYDYNLAVIVGGVGQVTPLIAIYFAVVVLVNTSFNRDNQLGAAFKLFGAINFLGSVVRIQLVEIATGDAGLILSSESNCGHAGGHGGSQSKSKQLLHFVHPPLRNIY